MFVIELSSFVWLQFLVNEETVNAGMPKLDEGGETLYCVDASLAFFGVAKDDTLVGGMGETVHVVVVPLTETEDDRRDVFGVTGCGNGFKVVDGTGGGGERSCFRFPSETVRLLLICWKTFESKPSTTRFCLSEATLLQSKLKRNLFTSSILEAM